MQPLSRIKKALALVSIVLFGSTAFAAASGNLRPGMGFGFGQSGAQSGSTTRVEGPLLLNVFFDYSVDSRFSVGAEHTRSMAGASSAIGFTGLSGKFYFWTPQPQLMIDTSDQIDRSMIVQKNIVPFLGLSVGFAQASVPAKTPQDRDVLVVGPYVSLRGGVEYPIYGRWGARGELVYGTTVAGKGAAETIQLGFGFYYFL